MTDTVRYRNSGLIGRAYKKLVLPDISSRLCALLVTLIDSLIAARWIGISAVSAIALVAPVTCFGECLHDFFVSGTTQVLIRYKSRGRLAEANRAFGAILADVFVWYVLIYGFSLLWMKDFFRLFTQDESLVTDAYLYYLPGAVAAPFCEAGLCLERGFKTDGRTGFFGLRAVITNVLNIIFSIAAVQLFHGGILGVSVASYAASGLGYCWSCSHFFSKQCTTRPDLSVVTHFGELRGYLSEERAIGSVYALDDGLYAAAATFLNKAYLLTGGTAALAAVGIADSVLNILRNVNGAIQGSAFNLCGLFYSDRDERGTALSMRRAVVLEAWIGAAFWGLVNLFAGQIGALYEAGTEEIMAALRICLLLAVPVAIGDCYTNLFSSFLLATEHTKAAGVFAVAHNVMIFLCALTSFAGIGFAGLLIACVIGSAVIALSEAFLLARAGRVPREKIQREIASVSFVLSQETCADISAGTDAALAAVPGLPGGIRARAALLTEECSRLILYVNRGCRDEIRADLRIAADEKECVITLIDTGRIFDPVHCLKQSELPEEYALSRRILLGFSPQSTFARVVNLNISHLILPLDGPQEGSGAKQEGSREA